MKKFLIFIVLAMMSSQPISAIGVTIINGFNDQQPSISVVYAGKEFNWQVVPESFYFKTGVHMLKGLKVYYPKKKLAFYYNLEPYRLRGAGEIMIHIMPEGECLHMRSDACIYVRGHTEMIKTSANMVNAPVLGKLMFVR